MTTKYPGLRVLLGPLRERAGIGTQTEFAGLIGATQQTISRWEKGESRPREKELPRLAALLRAEVRELATAAGYGQVEELAAPVDKLFPLRGLTPESFERFSLYLLQKLYPDPDLQVHRAGESGHMQGGIDISVRAKTWHHTFQCKRVVEFGPKKVAKAVADQTVVADKKFLLLSCTASPAAREEAARHDGWDIWDREDISSKVRSLAVQDQRALVHIFFRSQRFELLGELEDSPWLTPQSFFEPFAESAKLFNHNWTLVGRATEAAELEAALDDERTRVTMLIGPPGGGKSRLLKYALDAFERRHSGTAIWVLSPTDAATARSLEDLGPARKLLVIDDAHDREDIGLLMRHCADEATQSSLLLVLRPYGSEMIKREAASFALSGENVRSVYLGRPSLEDATKLAAEALEASRGPIGAAQDLARITRGSPLATVLGAQVVAKDGIHPVWINNDAEFQTLILSRFQDVITGGIATGQDIERLQGVLRVVALVQPVLPDEPSLLNLIEAVEGIKAHDATRLLKMLIDAGVLFRRGLRYRLSPDLLADSIIERHCLDTNAAADYIEQVFAKVQRHGALLKSLLVNLGRLDWRRRDGDTRDSSLLDCIWAKLRWIEKYDNPHVEAAAGVAYYQPRQALEFADKLVRKKHGNDEQVCNIIKYAAYNHAHLNDACMLLWRAATTSQESEGRNETRAINTLRALATFEPNKPVEFMHTVVDFAIEALELQEGREGSHTPFTILEGALEVDGHTSWAASSRSINLTAFVVSQEHVRHIRAKIISALFRCLTSPPLKRAVQAARTLQHALRSPTGLLGMTVGTSVRDDWMVAHQQTLSELLRIVETSPLDPVVLVRLSESVHWHAFYGPEGTKALALRLLAYLDRDLDTKLTRGLMDGWGSNTWPIDVDTHERSAHDADTKSLIEELAATYRDPMRLFDYIAGVVQHLQSVGPVGDGSQHLFLNRLIMESADLAQEIVRRYVAGTAGALADFGGAALGALLNQRTPESRHQVTALLATNSPSAIAMVAEAYVRFDPRDGYSAEDIAIIRGFFQSKSTVVLRLAAAMQPNVAKIDARLAAELTCLVDLKASGRWAPQFFFSIGKKDTIPPEAIESAQLERLVQSMEQLEDLYEHWLWRFLKLAAKRVPEAVVNLVKQRLQRAADHDDWRTTPLAASHSDDADGLGLLEAPNWQAYLIDLLDWAVPRIDQGAFNFVYGRSVVALFGKFNEGALTTLTAWMTSGSADFLRVRVVCAVLRDMSNTLIYDHPSFVHRAFQAAQEISPEAVEALNSTLFAVAVSGVRSGTPGEPFPQDLEQERRALEKLETLSRFDPAYELYSALLQSARQDIARQARQREAMDAEDEERDQGLV